MENIDKLTNAQRDVLAVLLSEGFDYNPSYEASIFYPKDIERAKDYAASRTIEKGTMRLSVIHANGNGSGRLSYEMSIFFIFAIFEVRVYAPEKKEVFCQNAPKKTLRFRSKSTASC